MYIDDFEDFYRADESEFPEEFDSRDNFEEDDTFEEFEELDDFRNDNILRDFDDTDDINEFDEMNDLDDNTFTCQGVCPFYRQFPFFPPTSGPDGPGRPGRPDGPGQGNRPPSGPPPSIAPQQQLSAGGPQLYAVDPGSIRGCRFRFVYIWPRRGRGFWMWLTFVGRRSIAGWRWNGFTWYYFGMDLRRIQSFRCY